MEFLLDPFLPPRRCSPSFPSSLSRCAGPPRSPSPTAHPSSLPCSVPCVERPPRRIRAGGGSARRGGPEAEAAGPSGRGRGGAEVEAVARRAAGRMRSVRRPGCRGAPSTRKRASCRDASAGDGGGTARRDLICVTGGSGFISSWPVCFLLDRGYTVHTTVNNLGDMPIAARRCNGTRLSLVLDGFSPARRSRPPASRRRTAVCLPAPSWSWNCGGLGSLPVAPDAGRVRRFRDEGPPA